MMEPIEPAQSENSDRIVIIGIQDHGQRKEEHADRGAWGSKMEFMLSSIGYAVGLGNIWRFPYLCYINGGGAFLIPYAIMLVFLGLPLFLLELSLGQYASQGPITVWRCAPMFKGIGYTMVVIGAVISTYYNVIIAFTVFYFFASFNSKLPWTECHESWQSPGCTNIADNSSNISLPEGVIPLTPAEDYWESYVLKLSDGIHYLGPVRWHLALCLLFAWIVVYLCIIKGIQSSGKVVYFTAIFPYVVLIILFFRGITLPGAINGIKFYTVPDFHKLKHAKVWKDAAVQILYSLSPGFGGLLTMASYNKFNNNVHRDTLIITFINCGTSVFAGFVIFSVLGYMSHVTHLPVSNVTNDGTGLAFVVYPQALSMMPASAFWAVLFFFMLFTLGLDSQFAGMECIITAIMDEFKFLRSYKKYFTLGLCILLYLLGLPCITQGGQYVIEMLDGYVTSLALLTVTFTECMVIAWVYGYRRFADDIYTMVGFQLSRYWLLCWTIVTPSLLLFVLLFMLADYDGIEFQGYRFPGWAEGIAWFIAAIPVFMIPLWMFIILYQSLGSWKGFSLLFCGPYDLLRVKLRPMWTPSKDWGPALKEHRTQSCYHTTEEEEPNGDLQPQPGTPRETDDITGNQFSYNTLDSNYVSNNDSYI